MRRNVMVVVGGLAALVGACSMFSAHSDVIEEAAGQQFTAQRFANFATTVKVPIKFDQQTGQFITQLWTDMTLFSQAVAGNKLSTDSTLVSEAMWPVIAQATAARWVDTVVARRARITDAAIDSAFKADKMRAVQHILVQMDSSWPKEQKDAAKKKADSILSALKAGASFSKTAAQVTDDPGSKGDSGYYGVRIKGSWDKPFDDELWTLKPGEMSGLVHGHFGYHIIRRPTEAESMRFFRDTLTYSVAQGIINAYLDTLSRTANVTLDGAAVPHMKAALDDLLGHENDNSVVATYKGGTFQTHDFVRFVRAATAGLADGPQKLDQLKSAPDSVYKQMAKDFTQADLVLQDAKKNNIKLTPVEWKQLEDMFASQVDSVKTMLGLTPQVLDPKASVHDRSRAAALRVDQFMNDLAGQKPGARLIPLPGVLSVTLRDREKTHFNPTALAHGLQLAQAQRSADSAKAGKSSGATDVAPKPAMIPAPNGAPVKNDSGTGHP
jgi:hypothetical protein